MSYMKLLALIVLGNSESVSFFSNNLLL